MNDFQREIYKTIDILTEQKLRSLGFDRTKRGRVVSINGVECVVQIDGENYTCKLRRGIYVEPNDIVFVKFPQNSNVDKYVETILGGNETSEDLVISAEEILAKLKTVDGHGSGLDADTLDGKHASEFATLDDLGDIGVDISGEAIVMNINESQSIIDDKNLSGNVNDAINKKHSHTNKVVIDSIAQDDIDTWDDVINKANKEHVHTESDIVDLDKYTMSEIDAKLNLKQNNLNYTPIKDGGNVPEFKSGLESAKPSATGSELVYLSIDTKKIWKDAAVGKWTQMGGQDLAIATKTTLGGIKVGSNLSIAADGTLSAVDDDSKSTFIVKQELFTATEGQTLFNLTEGNYQPNTNTISVYLYGGKQPNISISEISTSSFKITEPLKAGNVVLVEYIELSSATPYPIHGNDHLTGGYDPIPKVTTSSDGLMAKEDKGKLDDIEAGANKYTHPSNHPASMITESATKRFVSDTEKSSWSGKAEKSEIPTKVGQLQNDRNYVTQSELGNAGYGNMVKSIYDKNGDGIVDNAEKVNGFTVDVNVPANAKFTDTIYTHPISHPYSMITGTPTSLPTYHVSKTDTSDKNLLWINTNL